MWMSFITTICLNGILQECQRDIYATAIDNTRGQYEPTIIVIFTLFFLLLRFKMAKGLKI